MFSFCGFLFLGIHLTAGTETKAREDGIPWLEELCLRGNWLWGRPQSCASVFSIAGGMLRPKTAWEGKGFLPLTVYSLPWRGARGGAQRGNRKSALTQKPWRNAASPLTPHSFPSLLFKVFRLPVQVWHRPQ